MSRDRPAPDCQELLFRAACAVDAAAEVALEDYAREVSSARSAEAVLDAGGRVRGVHLCGPSALVGSVVEDIEGFARSLVPQETNGLGWS